MSAQKIAVVWNPAKVDEEELKAAFTDQSDVSWYETSVEDPGQGAARRALDDGNELVFAVGGDGTVRAVAEALAGSGKSLAIVPRGTGNLFARNLDIPLNNIPAAVERGVTGESSALDLGWVETEGGDGPQKYGFVVMVGFGIDAQMLAETDDDLKSKAGWLAYVEAMGRAVTGSELLEFTLQLDDEEPLTASGHTLLIGNCGMIQGGVTLLPDAKADDGKLDLLLVSAESVGEWLGTMKTMMWDNGVMRFLTKKDDTATDANTELHQATKVAVQLPSPQPFEVDGEEVGDVTAFTVSLQAGSLLVR